MRRLLFSFLLGLATFLTLTGPAWATHRNAVQSANMQLLFTSPNETQAVNSDIAFWGDRAYVGNYDGFRIFDISNPARPRLVTDYRCFGPQNDPAVWQSKNGKKRLLFLAVDRTLTGPECGSEATAHDDPNGWEGVRIFDVSNERRPRLVKAIYTDCGAHTITLYPKNPGQILLYVSSYPLRPGPTCGQVRGPQAGRDPLHGVIQTIRVPVNAPHAAKEAKELPIVYPGDPDNRFVWAEHGLGGIPGLEPAARACHDIGVFVELRLAAAACAEQGQLWRIRPNGMPDTRNPIWVFDDTVDETGTTGDPADPGVKVDFFHSATFSWDGRVVNFIDESFGDGCPPVTPAPGLTARYPGDSGRMFFLDTRTGAKLSQFMIPRREAGAYCSAHLGNTVAARGRNLLVNAWYMGGVDVIDFTNPRRPVEVAWFDAPPPGPEGSDNWSAYWYEGPALPGASLTIYGNDGVHNPATGKGFEVFRADVVADEVRLDRLNPQTQERVIR